MNITKKKLAKKLSNASTITIKDSEIFINHFISLFKENITSKKIKIHNFGTFKIKTSPERMGRNPKSGKIYKIKSQKKVSFKASSELKNNLN